MIPADSETFWITSQSLTWNLTMIWKWHPGIRDSFWKPSLLGSMLNLGSVIVWVKIFTARLRNKTTSSDQSLSTKNTTVAVIDSTKYRELSSEAARKKNTNIFLFWRKIVGKYCTLIWMLSSSESFPSFYTSLSINAPERQGKQSAKAYWIIMHPEV